MSASDNGSSMTGLVSDAAAARPHVQRHRWNGAEARQPALEVPDAAERRAQRRARRVALILMVASGLVSIVTLYGAWTLLRLAI